MVLQHIVWPAKSEQEEKELYYHGASEIEITKDKCIKVPAGKEIAFDTYFNCFSGEKWLENTTVDRCKFCFSAEGKGKLRLKTFSGHLVKEQEFDGAEEICIPLDCVEQEIYYLELQAEQETRILGGSIETELPGREVRLALATCTYNRPQDIHNTVKLLKERNQIQDEKEPILDGIYVVDNASNLLPSEIEGERVVLIPNKNTGGAGGFTKGLQEAVKNPVITHILLMDDDVRIEFEAIMRTKSLLRYIKKEKEEHFIGGAMFRRDVPYVLHAAGEIWNDGRIRNPYKNIDVRCRENVQKVMGTLQEPQAYAGWWYCCIPRSHVENKGYPMPLFLHVDDVEYSLRSGKTPIFLNGIAVWHEEFEDKRSSVMEYYDTRNRLIANAAYMKRGKRWNAAGILAERFMSSVLRYRYKDIDLILLAAEDFLKGPDWLVALESEEHHKKLQSYGYKMLPIDNVGEEEEVKHRSKWKTIVRYFLPAVGKTTLKVGALVGAYAGKKQILLVDSKKKNGFMVKKSWGATIVYGWKLFLSWVRLSVRYKKVSSDWSIWLEKQQGRKEKN